MKAYIYGLVDPRDGQIRYVGQTVNSIELRKYQHVYQSKKKRGRSGVANWICALADDGLLPDVTVLEEVEMAHDNDLTYVSAIEQKWIRRLRDGLTNFMHNQPMSLDSRIPEGKERAALPPPPMTARPLPPPPSMSPEDIRERRQRLGLSQHRLAVAIGYDVSTISLWEAGKRRPPPGLTLLFDRIERSIAG